MTGFQKLMNKRATKWRKVCAEHGVEGDSVINLYYRTTEFILPKLRAYYECVDSSPKDLTFRQWRQKLRGMIKAFDLLHRNEGIIGIHQYRLVKNGLKDFGFYFTDLWL